MVIRNLKIIDVPSTWRGPITYWTECSLGSSGVEGTTGYVIGVVEFDGSEVVLMGIVARCRC